MDINKLKVLKEINYTIKKTCNNCDNSFFKKRTDWGLCMDSSYFHNKHEKNMFVSINRYGYCEDWKISKSKIEKLGYFKNFLEGER